jgi:DNA-damage-inducible protein D
MLQCWNTEGIFRLIQSIPSPKAEPFKRWLARVGYERVQEIEDPELIFSMLGEAAHAGGKVAAKSSQTRIISR